jgi:hypothetical protein
VATVEKLRFLKQNIQIKKGKYFMGHNLNIYTLSSIKWLRHYAASKKVAGSRTDEVYDFPQFI